MRVNLRVIQVFSDALIPILGYFFWEWGLFFIVLYYLLDLLASEIFMHLKTRAIRLYQGSAMLHSMKYIALGMTLIVTSLLLVRLFVLQVHPATDILREINAFWSYKDMGIAQGYILIPLVFLVGYQRYKMEFVQQKKNETLTISMLWTAHLKSLVLLLTFLSLITGLTYFIIAPDWVYLSMLLAATSTYQLLR